MTACRPGRARAAVPRQPGGGRGRSRCARCWGRRRCTRRTGHRAEAFHVGPKVLWLRTHAPEVFRRTAKFLQPRDVVLHALTGEVATDETHANATVFFDLRARALGADLLAAFELDPALFPAPFRPGRWHGCLPEPRARPGWARHAGGDRRARTASARPSAPGSSTTGPVSEMAGASSCLNSVVAEPLARARGSPTTATSCRALLHRDWGSTPPAPPSPGRCDALGFTGFAELAARRPAATAAGIAGGGRRPRSRLRRCSCPTSGTANATTRGCGPASSACPTGTRARRVAYARARGRRARRREALAVLDRRRLHRSRSCGSAGGGARLARARAGSRPTSLGVPVRHLDGGHRRDGRRDAGRGRPPVTATQARDGDRRAARRGRAARVEPGPATCEAARRAWFARGRGRPRPVA